jgi:hypothetical protein
MPAAIPDASIIPNNNCFKNRLITTDLRMKWFNAKLGFVRVVILAMQVRFANFISIGAMETTIRINTDALGQDVVNSIKALFPHKMVEIIVHSADETEYISDNKAFSNELQSRINEYKTGEITIQINPNDLV